MRRGTLVAFSRPPGWMPIITRPSPVLFGFTDATSNALWPVVWASRPGPKDTAEIAKAAHAAAARIRFFIVSPLLRQGRRTVQSHRTRTQIMTFRPAYWFATGQTI